MRIVTISLTEESINRAKRAPLGWVSPAQVVHIGGGLVQCLVDMGDYGLGFCHMHAQDADVAPLCASTRERL